MRIRPLLALVGIMTLATSAYAVYANTASTVPPSVAFTWFSCFAFLTTCVYPRNSSALFRTHVPWRDRLALAYPDHERGSWVRLITRGPRLVLAIAAALNVAYFICLLTAIGGPEHGAPVTTLVLLECEVLVVSVAGFLILGDTCKRWNAFILGSVLTIAGTLLYKSELRATIGQPILDRTTWLTLGVIGTTTLENIMLARARRRHAINATDCARVLQASGVLGGVLWVAWDGVSLAVPLRTFLGCAYLGIVPTALVGIELQRLQDSVGTAAVEIVGSARPFLLMALGILPISWFALDLSHLTLVHIAGIALALVGITISITIGQPKSAAV